MRLLLLFVALAGCAAAPAPRPEPSPTRTLLWEARLGNSTTYLLGSIHMGREGIQLDPAIEAAWNRSEVLVVELVPGDVRATQEIVMRRAALPPGKNLRDQVSPAVFQGLAVALDRHGVPAATMERFEPWFAGMMLGVLDLQAAGFRAEDGIERRFLDRNRLPVVELESADRQLALFDELSPQLQEVMLADAVARSPHVGEELQRIERAFREGDAEGLERIALGEIEERPELVPFYERVLFERNVQMARRIVELHGSGKTHFVVVGAAHLVGERGIPALLARQGFSVRQVPAAQEPTG